MLELAYWSGMSQSEVAEYLHIPLGTVKTRTRSALARLADVLEGESSRDAHTGLRRARRHRPRPGESASGCEHVHDLLVRPGRRRSWRRSSSAARRSR